MKKFLAVFLAGLMALSMAACGGSPAPSSTAPTPESSGAPAPEAPSGDGAGASAEVAKPSSPYRYSMASGSVGGNFYLVGGGVAQVINSKLPDYFSFTTETTGGGTANLGMLQNGDAELGIAMTSSLFEAVNGSADWTAGVKHDKLRVAAALYPSWLTIYTLKDSGIKSFADLEGKVVGVGSKGAAMDSIFRQMFVDRGVTPKQIHNDGHGATATALGNGVIDAAILFSYPPFAAISELESTKDLSFIPLNEEEQKYLTETFSFYVKDAMPGGFYKGAPEEVAGVSEWNMLVSSSEVPEDQIYLITKMLFESMDDLTVIHQSLKYCTGKDTLNSNIYLHAGTVRCLKELNIDVPAELIPPEYQG